MNRRLAVAILAGLLLAAGPARATVDAFLQVNVPYEELQTGDVCFLRTPMWASLGIPIGSALMGTLAPMNVLRQNGDGTRTFVNINLVGTRPAIGATLLDDKTVGTTYEVSIALDFAALSAANGTTATGRAKTIRAAKLALLAIARDLEDLTPGPWRMWVKIAGLPSQAGLSGAKVYATTTSAYSAGSPLLASYVRELIDRNGSCPEPQD